MAQWKKCFSCNHEAWSFDIQDPDQCWWLCLPVYNSRAMVMETEALWGKLVDRTGHIGKFWDQARGPALMNVVESGNRPCMHACADHTCKQCTEHTCK